MNDFYVYAWKMPCGTPFYIGKGRGGRYTSEYGRSSLFKTIVAELRESGLEPTVEKISNGMAEPDAFALEMSLIAKYGRADRGGLLCNLTDGGEGGSGCIPSEITRFRMSAARKLRVTTDETRRKSSAAKRMAPPRDGYKGVYTSFNKWRTVIYVNGKLISLGSYDTPEEAARAYDAAMLEAWGDGNFYRNFPATLH